MRVSADTEIVRFVEERHARTLQLTRQLIDWRVIPTALAFSGALVLATGIAIGAPAAWLLVVLVLVAGWFVRGRFLRAVDVATAGLLVIEDDVERPSALARDALVPLPPNWLAPREVATAAQLERMLRPSSADQRAQFSELPVQNVLLLLELLGWFVGCVAAVLAPAAIVLLREDGLATALLVAAAGIPLLPLLGHSERIIAATRAAVAQTVSRSREELPRLWADDPSFVSGTVVVADEGGYRLDETKLPLKPMPSKREVGRSHLIRVLSLVLVVLTAVAFGIRFLQSLSG